MRGGGVEVGVCRGGAWSGGDGGVVEGGGLAGNADPAFF